MLEKRRHYYILIWMITNLKSRNGGSESSYNFKNINGQQALGLISMSIKDCATNSLCTKIRSAKHIDISVAVTAFDTVHIYTCTTINPDNQLLLAVACRNWWKVGVSSHLTPRLDIDNDIDSHARIQHLGTHGISIAAPFPSTKRSRDVDASCSSTPLVINSVDASSSNNLSKQNHI